MGDRTRGRGERRWRKPLRLSGHDYRAPGAYYVTLVTWQRECLFGEIVAGEMTLSDLGRVAQTEWQRAPTLRSGVRLDAVVVMPNHIHGIIWLDAGPAATTPLPAQGVDRKPGASGPKSQSLGALMAQTKAAISRRINVIRGSAGSQVWQHGYYDRLIRTDDELRAIRAYIAANPAHWADDEERPQTSARSSLARGE